MILVLSIALAAEPAPLPVWPAGSDTSAEVSRGIRLARVGESATVGGAVGVAVGVPVSLVGIINLVNCDQAGVRGACGLGWPVLVPAATLTVTGATAVVAGIPTEAIGGLAAARELRSAGVAVPMWPGRTALVLWGGALLAVPGALVLDGPTGGGHTAELSLIPLTLFGVSAGLAGVQLRMDLHHAPIAPVAAGPALGLCPLWLDDRLGIAVVGRL